MPLIPNDFEWETVAIPLAKGVDTNTRARLVPADTLLKAENVYFPRVGGPEKRRGHTAYTVVDGSNIGLGDPPSDNLYGYGLFDSSITDTSTSLSPYSEAGEIKEIITRDDEVVAWDGHRLYSNYSNGDSKLISKAYIPTCLTKTISKTVSAQNYSDCADNGSIRVVAHVDTKGTRSIVVDVYDSSTGTLKISSSGSYPGSDILYVRVIGCGSYCHVFVSDVGDDILYKASIHSASTSFTWVPAATVSSLGIFDVWKIDEDRFLVALIDSSNSVDIRYFFSSGVLDYNWIADVGATDPTYGLPINIAVAVHPVSSNVCILWDIGTQVFYRNFDSVGTALFSIVAVDSSGFVFHLAVAPTYLTVSGDDGFNLYLDIFDGTAKIAVILKRLGGGSIEDITRYNLTFCSKACRVGNTSFIWSVWESTLQSSYILLDDDLLPVAKIEYGTALENLGDPGWMPSINCVLTDSKWDTYNFHGVLHYNQRISGTGDNSGIFQERSTRFYQLNFLPRLSWTQAGRATYIAAGQMWSYDGRTLDEAQFPIGVEDIEVTPSNSTGTLTNSGKYRWRIDMCFKNAAGEEVRSISFLTDEITFGAADDTATLEWVQPPTRRLDSYYLIYRNENNGTLWYLVSSRDPSSAPSYTTLSSTQTFIDRLPDASLVDKELHPANTDGYLQPIAAPSCDLVSFGKDRLWISGGELSPGEVWPSRLFQPGTTPSFSFALPVNIDRSDEPVTGIGFNTDYTVVFKERSIYIISGNISGNILTSAGPQVQLAYTETGCINFKSVERLPNGLSFESSSGIKLINAAGGLENIGVLVSELRGTIVGAVIVRNDDNIRFYSSDQDAVVLDYTQGQWSTFTVRPQSAVLSPVTGLAVLAVGNKLYYESETSDTDGGSSFNYTIKTAWLAEKIGGFQRVKRVYCPGESVGIPPNVTLRLYYNERDFWSQEITWDTSKNLNASTWGEAIWGQGTWGDVDNNTLKDSVWRWRRRTKRQKCESISIEITDSGLITPTSKWIPTAIGLEIGKETGLQRVPNRTLK